MKVKKYWIEDIEMNIIVEETTRKNILGFLSDYIDNFGYDFYDPSDESFVILYKDGSIDFIDEGYDGHKIRKQNILSMVYTNPETCMTFGNYEVNEYGVVTVAE